MRLGKPLSQALAKADDGPLAAIVDSVAISKAQRELMPFNRDEAGNLVSLLPPGIASLIIDEAPIETAQTLIERREITKIV